jgi:hypothetical protein
MINRLNIKKKNLECINYHSLGWPFSIYSSIFYDIKIQCQRTIPTGEKCTCIFKAKLKKCPKCKNEDFTKDKISMEESHYRKGFHSFPFAVHIDLQNQNWKPNKDLKDAAGKGSLDCMSLFWFKKNVAGNMFILDSNVCEDEYSGRLYLYSQVTGLRQFCSICQNFGTKNNQITWFEYDANINLVSEITSGILEKIDFYFILESDSEDKNDKLNIGENISIKHFDKHDCKNSFDLNSKGFIVYEILIKNFQHFESKKELINVINNDLNGEFKIANFLLPIEFKK